MFCTNCGKQQPDGAKFCTNCGAPLAAPDQTPAQPSSSPDATQVAPAAQPAPAQAQQPGPQPAPARQMPAQGYAQQPGPDQGADKKPGHGKTIGIAVACVAIVAVAAVAIYFILFSGKAENNAQVAPEVATTEAATTDAATTEEATTSGAAAATSAAASATTSAGGSAGSSSASENVGEVREGGDVSYTDPHYGFQLRLPDSYVITSAGSSSVTYTDPSTQIEIYAYAAQRSSETPHSMLVNLGAETDIEYKAEGDDWCVASWKSDGYEYYNKYYVTANYTYAFDFKYPISSAQAGSDVIEAYIKYFKPGTM